jgi:hypothetical protein
MFQPSAEPFRTPCMEILTQICSGAYKNRHPDRLISNR